MAHLAIAILLGVGFMVLELSLAQRLTLLCGRPAVAFAAVIGGMLLGAGGVGLLVASRNLHVSLPAALGLSAAGCLVSVVVPDLLELFGVLALPSGLRAVVVALAAALCASPLGLGFPGLVEAAAPRAPSSAPWLYGLNATVSVGAAALHAGLAPTFGLMGTSLLAAGCYAVAAVFAMTGGVALAPLGQT